MSRMVQYSKEGNYSMGSVDDPEDNDCQRAIYCYEQALSEAFQIQVRYTGLTVSSDQALTTTHSTSRRVLGVHFDDDLIPPADMEVVRFIINLRSTARYFLLLPVPFQELRDSIETTDVVWGVDVAEEAFKAYQDILVITIPPGAGCYCKTRKYLHDGWVRKVSSDDENRDATLFFWGYFGGG